MNCRNIGDILMALGSRAAEEDPAVRKHCQRCEACSSRLREEMDLDELLGSLPKLKASPNAIAAIMGAVACSVEEQTVLSFLDDSLEGPSRKRYESHRQQCKRCQSLESQHAEVWDMLGEAFPKPLPHNPLAIERCKKAVFGKAKAPAPRSRSIRSTTSPWQPFNSFVKIAAALLVAALVSWWALGPEQQKQIAHLQPSVQDPDQKKDPPKVIPIPKGPKKEDPLEVQPKEQKEPKDSPKKTPKVEVEPRNDPPALVHEPKKPKPIPETIPAPDPEEVLLASLSKEDREIVRNLDLLESMDAAENYEVVMDSEILAAVSLEDFE